MGENLSWFEEGKSTVVIFLLTVPTHNSVTWSKIYINLCDQETSAEKAADSVEIISPPAATTTAADKPETITISSEDILSAEVVDSDTKITESVAILETVEVVKEVITGSGLTTL